MNTIRISALSLILLFCFFQKSKAQQSSIPIEIGFGVGGMSYTGDVVKGYRALNQRLAGEAFLRYNPHPAFNLRAGLLYGRAGGSDADSNDPFQQERGIEFSTEIIELNGRLEYNFRNFRHRLELFNWSPFIFVGVGGAVMEVDGNFYDDTVEKPQIVVPFGIGMKYAMAYNWNLGFEFGARKTFTDNIDSLLDDPNASKFQRNDPENNDMYYYIGFSVSYTFEGTICPIIFK